MKFDRKVLDDIQFLYNLYREYPCYLTLKVGDKEYGCTALTGGITVHLSTVHDFQKQYPDRHISRMGLLQGDGRTLSFVIIEDIHGRN